VDDPQRHLEEGRQRIVELRSQMKVQYEAMQNLQESINCLNDEVEDQRLRSEELQQTLVDTESRLKESIELVRFPFLLSFFFSFCFSFCFFPKVFPVFVEIHTFSILLQYRQEVEQQKKLVEEQQRTVQVCTSFRL